jgi:two-component system cell cycle sensor histidine kinase/response regulator CckA
MMTRAITRPRILLAEDDDDTRSGLADLLVDAGFDVAPVASGTEMLELLSSSTEEAAGSPDLIITDVIMPGFSGIHVIEELRAEGWRQPIVVISGFDPATVESRIAPLRGVCFLAKPLDPPEVVALARTLTAPPTTRSDN